MPKATKVDLETLRNLALGKLPADESRRIFEQMEKDKDLSEQFEIVVELLQLPKEEWEEIERLRKR